MSDKFKNAVVNISEVSQTEKQIRFKTAEGNFSFFLVKQDGEETKAYKDWQEFDLKAGKTIEVGYKEVEFTTKDGKTAKVKNVVGFKKANPSIIPQTKKEEVNWEAISRGKVRHGLVCAMIQAGWKDEDIKTKLMMYEEIVMNGLNRKNEPVNEEGIDLSEIPF
jgi:hypothetical protein